MFPLLIDLGRHDLPLFGEVHLFLPTYGVLFAGSVLLAWWWFMRRARRSGVADEVLFNLGFFTLLGGILGAKLLLIAIDWRTYLAHPGEILGVLRAAGVLVGGVACGALVFVLYARRHGLPVMHLADAIAAPLALAQAIGRLGCFSAGCCWGRETHAGHPLAVTFSDPAAQAQTGVALHTPLIATQLIEFTLDALLAVFLTVLWRARLRPPGTVFWVYVLLYSIGRGTIEFWRGDAQRGLYFGDLVSTSQLFALGGFLLAAVMLVRRLATARSAGDDAAPAG